MLRTLSCVCVVAMGLVGCRSSYQPSISVACEEDEAKSSVIRWETFPAINGLLKVYASTNPGNIPLDNPIATTHISEQMITITASGVEQRMYYTMIFDDEFPVMTASRNVIVPGVQNFRDIGGYPASGPQNSVTWGKLYRSAQLDSISPVGVKVLEGLGIKTILDLRDKKEYKEYPSSLKQFKVMSVPVSSAYINEVLTQIHEGRISADSVSQIITRINIDLVDNFGKELRKIFRILSDEGNYPLVIQCSTGQIRVGLVTAFLLDMLGVNTDVIVRDYELSKYYYDVRESCKYGYSLPEEAQEALTALHAPQGDYLDETLEYLASKYNSVDNYLSREVGVSKRDIKQLRSILLQKQEP